MIDPLNRPTRLLRFVAGFARWSLGCLLVLWLLLAVGWGALHGWIVPRIGEFRPQLEAQAARALGVPVRIGSITARSEGLIPSVELLDVALLDAQGRAALQLPRVVVALSPRSLLRFGFEQVYIEGPQLDVRRAADGRVFIAGMAFDPRREGFGALQHGAVVARSLARFGQFQFAEAQVLQGCDVLDDLLRAAGTDQR